MQVYILSERSMEYDDNEGGDVWTQWEVVKATANETVASAWDTGNSTKFYWEEDILEISEKKSPYWQVTPPHEICSLIQRKVEKYEVT